jgi:hypothetical protein
MWTNYNLTHSNPIKFFIFLFKKKKEKNFYWDWLCHPMEPKATPSGALIGLLFFGRADDLEALAYS